MKRLILLAGLLVLLANTAYIRADEKLYLEQISVSESLPHTDVNAIAGDSEGFIWFATLSGLCRYDGVEMEVFNVTNSILRSSRIKSLYASDDGMLYIGTETGGLTVFDTVNDRFVITLPVPLNNVNGIFSHNGKICLCTDAGISIVEISDGSYNIESHWISTGVMGGCSIPGKGMALCSPSGLYLYEDGAKGMGTASIRQIMAGSHCISSVYLEERDMILVAGYDGCISVNCRDWSTRQISNTETISLYEAPDGHIWAGTRKEGIICYGRDFSIMHRYGPYEEYGFDSCDITSFHMDLSSVLWIGTIGNGCYKKIGHTDDFRLYSISDGIRKDHIVCMYADSSDRLWISTRDGSLYVMTHGRITKVNGSSMSEFGNMPISFIYEDINGSIWIGAWTHGIRVIGSGSLGPAAEGRKFSFMDFRLPTPINAASIYMADSDDAGNIWMSSNYGVFRYVPGKSSQDSEGNLAWYRGSWSNFTSSPADSCSLADNFCTDILTESHEGTNYVWVGSRFGLTRFICSHDGEIESITRINPSQEDTGLSGDYVSVIHKDRDDTLWIATLGGGLNKLTGRRDSTHLCFRHYNSRNVPFINNEFESLQEDRNGIFWIGSSRGLTRFDPYTGTVKTFSKKDGLQSDVFKIWASARFRDGRMAFGGPEGFNIFDPLKIGRNMIPPKTVLTGLEINGRPIAPGDTLKGKVVLQRPLRHLSGIVLPYDCNSLTFRFASLHYEHPEMNRYRFMLEGMDCQWRYTDQASISTTYLNLKPGKYMFRVSGSNCDGIWGSEPASLSVTIRPPLWGSAAAYIFYCLVFLYMMWFLRNSIRKRNRQHYQLEMEHKLRIEEEQRNENELKFHTDFLHEIKTPLTLISAPVNELLDSANLGKTTRDRLQLVRRSTMILQKLLDTVTDLRKYDNGNIRLHVVEVDFCRFVEETVLLFVPYMKSRGIQFSLDKPDSPIMLYIDKMEMEKVVMNLMSNAIRYSPEEGGGEIKVSISMDAGTSGWVMLSVSNIGIGIMPEDLTRIFERFQQGTNNSTKKGMGIGLAISRHVVTLHGGEIYAESVPGRNTVFHVRLRTGDSHFREDEIDRGYSNSDDISNYDKIPDIIPDKDGRHDGNTEKTHTVLIADDSPDLRDYLRHLLSIRYNVICASDGREGYERAIADQPDIIISDVIMPEMDGLELCQRIKKNPDTSHIPVILLSARNLPLDKVEGFDALADEYMTKPFQSDVLLSRIGNLIRQRESMREAFRKNIFLEPSAVTGTTSDERFIRNVIAVIEEHMAEPEFGIDELCREIGISRPSLYRKIKSLTGLSAIRFLRSIRLKRAAQLLDSDEGLTVSSVMYSTGFSNMSYFSRIFFEEFHILPKDYHGRKGREQVQ